MFLSFTTRLRSVTVTRRDQAHREVLPLALTAWSQIGSREDG